MTENVRNNWQQLIWVAGLLFVAGGIYSEFKIMHKEQEQTNAQIEALRRQVWEEIEQRVDDLEEWKAFTDGYNQRQAN